jgi:opacity protein-like surface antigen
MSRSCVFIAFLVITTAAATAQQIPQFDLFGGYSFGHVGTRPFANPNLNGWDVSLTYNLNKWFGIAVEGSGLYGSQQVSPPRTIVFVCPQNPAVCPLPISIGATDQSQKVHTYSLGPRFYLRNHTRYTPFARALFGGGYISEATHISGISGSPPAEANGGSILTAGGGVDIAFTSRMAFRTQADFLRNRFFHETQPDFRLATGLVFHFGHK